MITANQNNKYVNVFLNEEQKEYFEKSLETLLQETENDISNAEKNKDEEYIASLTLKKQEILHALSKFQKGSYGKCEATGANIPIDRLHALPYTQYTKDVQEQLQKEEVSPNAHNDEYINESYMSHFYDSHEHSDYPF